MSFLDSIRKTKVPTHKEVLAIPNKLKQEAKNQKINTINVRYFDRGFKKFIPCIGILEHKTSIPIVYFETPSKLAVIKFDDCTYIDYETNIEYIDVCEDYPYGLNHNTELAKFLNVQYYNDFAENIIGEIKDDTEKFKAYKIPVMLNRIPREIIRINTDEELKKIDEKYVNHKTEITQYLVKQFGNVIMFDRVGKKDNSFLLTGVLIGASMGMLIGIFISFAFLR